MLPSTSESRRFPSADVNKSRTFPSGRSSQHISRGPVQRLTHNAFQPTHSHTANTTTTNVLMDSIISSSRAAYSNSLLPEAAEASPEQEDGASFDRRPSETTSASSPETEEVGNDVTTTTSSSVASNAPSLLTSSSSVTQVLALPTSTSMSQGISTTIHARDETSPKMTKSELLGILDQALEVSAPLSASAPSLRDVVADPSMMNSTRDRLLQALQRLHAAEGRQEVFPVTAQNFQA